MDIQKNQSFLSRLRFAVAGVIHGLRTERSLRTQALALIAVVIAFVVLRPAPLWWALVLLASSAVIAAELFNTAVERLADHLHPELHPEIRIVKDCAAAGAASVGVALAIEMLRDGSH